MIGCGKFAIFIVICTLQTREVKADNEFFGPYEVIVTNLSFCAGPLPLNGSILYVDKVEANGTLFTGRTVSNFTRGPIKAALKFYRLKKNNYEYVTTFKMPNVCLNPSIKRQMLKKAYKVNTRCDLLEGTVNYENISIAEFFKLHIGDKIFYGNYKFNVVLTSSKYNIFCVDVDLKFTKM